MRGADGSYPEVDFLHLRILLEIGCLSLEHRASGLQDVGVVGNIQLQSYRLLRQQDGQSLRMQAM